MIFQFDRELTPEEQWERERQEDAAEHFHEIDPRGRFAGDFEGTPLAVEAHAFADGVPFFEMPVAGLQYADYGRRGLDDKPQIPQSGDRLQLVRNPENRADRNAVEVWWRNNVRVGHVPRVHAALLAPALDTGLAARAYVVDPGNGAAWTASIVVIGAAAAALGPTPTWFPARPAPRPPAYVPGVLGAGYDLDDIPF